MPRPLAGFFVSGEGDVGLNLAQNIADCQRFEAQTRVPERELAEERLTIDQAPHRQEEMLDEPRAPAGQ